MVSSDTDHTEKDALLSGACGCGKINYTISGPLRTVVNCHCNSCRRHNGTPYSTYCVIGQDSLNITLGQELLRSYSAWNGGKKQVCSYCGSPIYNAHERYPGLYMLYYGSLTDYERVNPKFNIYCEDKLAWVEDIANLSSFAKALTR